MAKLVLVLGICVLLAAIANAAINGDCPLSSQHTSCSPKCLQDHECVGGEKCCPNLCNAKSCVRPKIGSNTGGSGYKGTGSNSGGSGSYCGNVKCNSYEKCDLDRATKRMRCVRA